MDSYRHMSVVVMLNSVELLVDLMRFPGQLIPFSDKATFISHISATEDEPADYDSCDSPLEPNSPFFGFSDRTNNESPGKNEISQSLLQRKIGASSNIYGPSLRPIMLISRNSQERHLRF